ncbi:hypothetical protein GJ699_06930 [Duganella sp. FT80W]|uniref:Uncharacterized protein n=1 Tax=Duganella guangzhouensis TaxID=2666084 RepID=A0A6I2KVZ2_9BURK|nr:hypothetical protein [Duganella guangzhouensis]MRW89712.1 hypothetical protein [Duganella guangzhouensis]
MCETKHGISLRMTLAQGDLILQGLAERPFKQVYELIGKLHQQAAGADPEQVAFELTHAELRLVLEVLGELPFNRVQRLLHSLHAQIEAWRNRALEMELSED